jgi:hypothetical protein
MKEIELEVFRADTRASRGITSTDIADLAAAYNADENPVAAVIGHPKDDTPAHGVISAFRAEGNKLFATLKDVSEELVDSIKSSKIINRSMAFFGKDHEANPTPGKLAPRHLGFLGGSAPGIPGMSSLKKALSFSAEDDIIIADGAPSDAIIFEAATPVVSVQEEQKLMSEKTQEQLDAEFKAREDAIAERERQAEEREKQFAADAEKAHNAAAAARVDSLVATGKVLPANRDDLVKVFSALKGDELEFSADDKSTAGDKLAKIFAAGPDLVDVSGKKLSPDQKFSADKPKTADEITAAANKLVEEKGISFAAAVEQIETAKEQ